MHIDTLSLQNWKGCTRKIELKPVTVIYGKNRLGKTAVADALRVGLLGYSPRHGKRAGASFGFVGSKQGATKGGIVLSLSDGQSIAHMWTKRKGKVHYEPSPMPVTVPAIMLDFDVYLNMSGPEKMRYIFRLVPLGDEFTELKIAGSLRRAVSGAAKDIEGWGETHETALQAVLDLLHNTTHVLEKDGTTVHDWIEHFVEALKSLKSSKTETARSMAAVSQGVSELAGLAAGFDAVRLKQLYGQYTAKEKELTLADQVIQDNQEILSERSRVEREIASLPSAESHDEPDPEQITWAERYQSNTPVLKERLKTATNNIRIARDEAERTENRIKALNEETVRILENDYCPTCNQKGEAWKESFTESQARTLEELKTARHRLELTVENLAKDAADLEVRISESDKQDARRETIQSHVNAYKKAMSDQEGTEERRSRLTARRDALTPKPCLRSEDRTRLAEEVSALRQSLDQEIEKEKQHTAHLADRRRIEQAKVDLAAAEAFVAVTSVALGAADSLQQQATQKALSGSRDKASVWTRPILGFDVEFRNGDIGYQNGATWVSLPYFSGIEDLLAIAGLSVALSPPSSVRIVLMDELGRLHPELKTHILRRAAELLAEGTIDQFIGLDVTKPAEDFYSVDI